MFGPPLPREAGIDARPASESNEGAMKLTRPHDPPPPAPVGSTPAPRSRPAAVEDRDWRASSLDLAEGLIVVEFSDTMPAEFRELS